MTFKNILLGICIVKFLHVEAKYKDYFISTKLGKTSEINNTPQETLKLLHHCLEKSIKNVVVLTNVNDNDPFLSNYLIDSEAPLYSFEIHDEANILTNHKRFTNVYKLNETHIEKSSSPITSAYIAISNDNTTRLSNILKLLRNSIWWNHQAYFFIANLNSAYGCQLANEVLHIAWSFNLLSVVYLCNESNNEISLYTFNPYASIAPKSWKKVESCNFFVDPPWTLFQHSLEGEPLTYDTYICGKNIFFNKVKQLHGYNLKALVNNDQIINRYDKTKVGYERFDGIEYRIMSTALMYINATLTVKDSSADGYIDAHGEPHGLLKDIITGTVDIFMWLYLLRDNWKIQTHSFLVNTLKIATLKTPLTYMEKLATILTSNFFTFLFITSLICVMTLKYILKVSTSLAFLECMRIFTSASTVTMPRNVLEKIALICCVVLEFLFSTFILSSLSAVSTDDNKFLTINTPDALIKSNLTIFGYASYKDIIEHKEIRSRLNLIDYETNCHTRLIQGDRIACITTSISVKPISTVYTAMHVSKGNLAARSSGFIFADDSPLIGTFQSIFIRLNEGGFIRLILDREFLYQILKFSDVKNLTKSSEIEQFIIPCCILIGSWILGFLVLCVEIIVFKCIKLKKKYVKS